VADALVRKVAIVDDDPSVRRGLSRLLAALRWEVVTFASAEDFLHSLLSVHADLVILDIHLPGMTGIDLALRLRELSYPAHVILMTAQSDAETKEALSLVRSTACLRKPFTREQLLGAIV
jgi:FixJ family two-component response regulator